MTNYATFADLSPTTIADCVPRKQVMDIGIHPLWVGMPRIAGPAFTVRCAPGDNLMLHAAIYRAAPGSIIVVQGSDVDYALAGGNVCAIAQNHGVAGFVLDGVVRDIAESRENGFPIFGRGVIPIPGVKKALGTMRETVTCGGVEVSPGDIVVADEEGIVVVPQAAEQAIFKEAVARAEKDDATSLADWESSHHANIDKALKELGFSD